MLNWPTVDSLYLTVNQFSFPPQILPEKVPKGESSGLLLTKDHALFKGSGLVTTDPQIGCIELCLQDRMHLIGPRIHTKFSPA